MLELRDLRGSFCGIGSSFASAGDGLEILSVFEAASAAGEGFWGLELPSDCEDGLLDGLLCFSEETLCPSCSEDSFTWPGEGGFSPCRFSVAHSAFWLPLSSG